MDFGTKKSSPSIRDVANTTITTLNVQKNKLENTVFRLKQRDQGLFNTCTSALAANNREKANIYAAELGEVRRLGKLVYGMQLNIEGVILRIETIRELSDAMFDLRPTLKLLQDASSGLFQVLPDVSAELNSVTNTIQETLHITKLNSDGSVIPVGHKTEGGEEILKEVSAFMERKLTEGLPEPPVSAPAKTVKTLHAPVRERVALSASTSEVFGAKEIKESGFDVSKTLISFKSEVKEITMEVKQPVSSKQQTLEEVLLEYVRKCDGELDLSRCSSELKTTDAEIERALETLGTQGKIKLELKSPE
jgi:division protein CdvB (Snf7/Vps24/ESCRT-III family)/Sec-independent protein translocase protein TatA